LGDLEVDPVDRDDFAVVLGETRKPNVGRCGGYTRDVIRGVREFKAKLARAA
jgi:hypothetical protein